MRRKQLIHAFRSEVYLLFISKVISKEWGKLLLKRKLILIFRSHILLEKTTQLLVLIYYVGPENST